MWDVFFVEKNFSWGVEVWKKGGGGGGVKKAEGQFEDEVLGKIGRIRKKKNRKGGKNFFLNNIFH